VESLHAEILARSSQQQYAPSPDAGTGAGTGAGLGAGAGARRRRPRSELPALLELLRLAALKGGAAEARAGADATAAVRLALARQGQLAPLPQEACTAFFEVRRAGGSAGGGAAGLPGWACGAASVTGAEERAPAPAAGGAGPFPLARRGLRAALPWEVCAALFEARGTGRPASIWQVLRPAAVMSCMHRCVRKAAFLR
jgi:hypothetical protein